MADDAAELTPLVGAGPWMGETMLWGWGAPFWRGGGGGPLLRMCECGGSWRRPSRGCLIDMEWVGKSRTRLANGSIYISAVWQE
jgi:hypothetical protein